MEWDSKGHDGIRKIAVDLKILFIKKQRKFKKERNKKYKKTNNVQLEPHKTSGWNRVPQKRVEFLLHLILVINNNL